MPPINDSQIRILVASDIHLGYAEKIHTRANDSFNSFDELLGIGKDNDVDLCILGGDLYHENKPTRSAQIKCVQILSKHVLGSDSVYLEYKSDPTIDFQHCTSKGVNYEDENMNISLPVFSIHGNHDDPSGLGGYSCLDLLHESKLVNYFGKVENLKEITVSPIMLQKNGVHIAIYGLSCVKDERLHRLLREKKVTFTIPEEEEKWFYILVLHQNRAKRGPTNYIPESFLPSFFHLIIWGHEHDCRIEPETTEKSFFISQPGSPVATSLCEGEAIQKKVGILTINSSNEFKMDAIPLQTVRPLIFMTKSLTDYRKLNLQEKDEKKLQKSIEKELMHEVEDMISEQVPLLLTGHPKQGTKPLLRLRIEYTDERQQLNTVRFGNAFMDRVANYGDILLFKRKTTERGPKDDPEMDSDRMQRVAMDSGKSMEDYLTDYFRTQDDNMKMSLLSLKGLNSAVNNYITKSDNDAIGYIVRKQLERRQEKLLQEEDDLEDDSQIQRAIEDMCGRLDEDREAALASEELNVAGRMRLPVPEESTQVGSDSDNSDEENESPAAAKNGPARGRGGRGGAAASRKKTISDDEFSLPESCLAASQPPTRGRGGRGSRGPRARGAAASKSGARGGQMSLSAAFANQTQKSNSLTSQASNISRVSQRNKKQMFDSDSD